MLSIHSRQVVSVEFGPIDIFGYQKTIMKISGFFLLIGIVSSSSENVETNEWVCENLGRYFKRCILSHELVDVKQIYPGLSNSLQLDDHRITSIAPNTFKNLSILELSLGLAEGKLHLTKDSFKGLAKLESLLFTSGTVLLQSDLFEEIPMLKNLTLTVDETSTVYAKNIPRLPNLKSLRIWNSHFYKIDNGTFFNSWPTITHLDLSRNSISDIREGAFSPLGNLKFLNITFKTVSGLKGKIFRGLENLETLSFATEMKEINNFLFSYLIRLKILTIWGHKIEEIENYTFQGLDISELTSNNNKMRTLKSKMLAGLRKLRLLDLSSNQIQRIEPQAFSGLNLLSLNLNDNRVSRVEADTFKGLVVQYLFLSCRINDIEDGAFDQSEITSLHLNNNNLKLMSRGFFSGMKKLNYADLSYNQISVIQSKCFFNLNLSALNLEHNKLTSITNETFQGLHVEKLQISNNNIQDIDDGSFLTAKIKNLFLVNTISIIRPKMFEGLNRTDLTF